MAITSYTWANVSLQSHSGWVVSVCIFILIFVKLLYFINYFNWWLAAVTQDRSAYKSQLSWDLFLFLHCQSCVELSCFVILASFFGLSFAVLVQNVSFAVLVQIISYPKPLGYEIAIIHPHDITMYEQSLCVITLWDMVWYCLTIVLPSAGSIVFAFHVRTKTWGKGGSTEWG